jgi:hypothetical protein
LVAYDDDLDGLFDIPSAIPYEAAPLDDHIYNYPLLDYISGSGPFFGFEPQSPTFNTPNRQRQTTIEENLGSAQAESTSNDLIYSAFADPSPSPGPFCSNLSVEGIRDRAFFTSAIPAQDAMFSPLACLEMSGESSSSATVSDFTASQSKPNSISSEPLTGNGVAKIPTTIIPRDFSISGEEIRLGKRKRSEENDGRRPPAFVSSDDVACQWAHCGVALRGVSELR